jgi:hypothetical protein
MKVYNRQSPQQKRSMDFEILQKLQQLFALWNDKQQSGVILLSKQQLVWMHTDGTEVDLTKLLQPVMPRTTPLISNDSKPSKRLQDCYQLGQQLRLEPDKPCDKSTNIKRTAQRVYDFYQYIGEQQLGQHPLITPSYLNRLTNTQFENLKIETLSNIITFRGLQAGEGDDLLSV